MNTHPATHATGGWLDALKRLFLGAPRPETAAAERRAVPEEARPITSDEIVDESSEESFPASDPPSYTGTTSFT